uniref:Uncharacterized protein n=1 Tax=Hucho hucho TaxID=62062 RepID=A0A4W5LIL2_9TELE
MQRGGIERHPGESGRRGGAKDSGLRSCSSHSDHHTLSKITQNARESIGVLGQGLKQLFQQQRRRLSFSRFTLDYLTPFLAPLACPDFDPPSGVLLAPPAGQGAGPVGTMRRGTSLQSRRSKGAGGNGTGAGQHSGRPRSSSTTDNTTPSSPSLGYHPGYATPGDVVLSSGFQSTEETDRVSDVSCQ